MKNVPALIGLAFLLLPACRPPGEEDPERASVPLEPCLEGPAQEEAEKNAGMTGPASAILPIGRSVTPVGQVTAVGRWPLAAAFSPDGSEAYLVHNGTYHLTVLDTATATVKQTVPGVGGFRGLLVAPDGRWIITADASQGTVSRLGRGDDGAWEVLAQRELPGAPTSLAWSSRDQRVIAVSGLSSRVWELEPETLEVLADYMTFGVYPYDVVLDPSEDHVVFSHTGSDRVTRVARPGGQLAGQVDVGLNPMGMAVDPTKELLYVANSDATSVSVVSLAEPFGLLETRELAIAGPLLPGATPNELLLAEDGNRLFVSFADLNLVGVYALPGFERLGAIPAGMYTTGLAASAAKGLLLVVGSKGWGAPDALKKWQGIVSLVPLDPPAGELSAWTAAADANVLRPGTFFDGTACEEPLPLPLDPAADPVLEHVVVVVRENKTYDAVLGDLESGNGDPALTVFGEQYTPNLHRIARDFVNLDNYYADSEESFQGHTWTTQADCNDYFEKLYPADFRQFALGGVDPNAMLAERSVFDHLWDHGVTFRNYGEFESFTKELLGDWEGFINQKFPYYNLSIPDVWKAGEFVRELELGIFPQFVYIALPNDHTAGGKAGMPTPASMVADNDEATGMILEAISHSAYWESTIVFFLEDDPQGYGGDHVHSHRSVCVVASPWVRKGYVSSVLYSIPAMYRTIEMILRLPPMNLNTALAPPMLDIFLPPGEEDSMDPTPYDLIPRLHPVEFNPDEGKFAAASAHIDVTRVDGVEGLGEIIWRMMKGAQEPPPYAKWRDD
ncbi:MAG: bifunctional YncE family protein/alkaline phosphatase family protein [Deltaproteobacteria bacterium]|nr:bifunctional YncE family protein/alkaline phosphatase family protein [Deltaproteobacteria bacterium]